MKTIIWKELRENLKWAVLALLSLLLAELGTLHLQRDRLSHGYGDLTICGSSFLLVTAFGCAIIGAALGALQILPELRRDQWAALLHRPVTRRTIFFGKVVAGLVLYFLATTVPLLVSVAYAALPGRFPAPLVPGMIRSPASDLLLGAAFYFAALLLSLSRGPWYGRRSILALYLVPVLLFHLESSWPFLVTMGVALIGMAAACGAMLSNGPVKTRPKLGQFAFVILLLAGVQTGLLLVLMGLALLPGASDKFHYTFQRFVLTHEGDVFVVGDKMDGTAGTLTHVDGTPVTEEQYVGNYNNGALFCEFFPFIQNLKYDRGMMERFMAQHPRWLANYVQIINEGDSGGAELWYDLVEKNYFVGYDKISRRRVGICDHDGFHPADATAKPFPERLRAPNSNYALPLLYWSGAQLYGFDFAERRMAPLFNAGHETIYDAVGFGPHYGNGKAAFIAVGLEKGMQFMDPRGTPVMTVPYGHDPAIWSGVSLATIPALDRIFIEYEPDNRGATARPGMTLRPSFVDEVDLHGKVTHTYSTVFQPPSVSSGWAQPLGICAAPLVPAILFEIYIRALDGGGSQVLFTEAGWYQSPYSCLAVLFGIGVVLGIGTLFWARRVGLPEASARRWAAFVFCFGLPGFITFRLGADWPTRIPCPQCTRERSIAAEECPECHQAWPAPASNGTEIFQPAVH